MPTPKIIITILIVSLVGFALVVRVGAGRKLLGV
jgi:hypothetical protein